MIKGIAKLLTWLPTRLRRLAVPDKPRRILRASPTAAGPCSRDAWFLVILCFISLLKCVLARLFLDVNFQVFNTDAVTFGAQNLLFGMLGAQFGTLGDHVAIQGVQTWIFIDFWWISGPHFESFSGTLNQNWCLFSCLFPGHFSKRFWGLNLDVWCSKNKNLVWDGCKNQLFTEVGILLFRGSIFDVFGWPWDQFSWLLRPGDGLEIWWVFMATLRHPQFLGTLPVEGNHAGSQAHCQQPDCEQHYAR